ncbi:hypothetical protein HXX76_009386 [Chlamydomonas incerta]|uniref:Uncharacterized protein n=1 Tax=Chlamydomonas incerta TaxID=51695 RepID=A0A835VZR6_CHLIN|nr:hypothetical protein HXX76_009386 [Chlamydomonas incerta]|eukprot:KAG2431893.1 hypothetical protein HXX76_009386 [Chlamydomonas incerta]
MQVLLIPAYISAPQTAAAPVGSNEAPGASSSGDAELPMPCFNLYFLPYNPMRDGSLDTVKQQQGLVAAPAAAQTTGPAAALPVARADDGPSTSAPSAAEPLSVTWLQRRIYGGGGAGARRSERIAAQALPHLEDEVDIKRWREELAVLDHDPLSGLPRAEARQLLFCGPHWDPVVSSFASSPGLGCSGLPLPRSHISCVTSVVPGTQFIYALRPFEESLPDDEAEEAGGGGSCCSEPAASGGTGSGDDRQAR